MSAINVIVGIVIYGAVITLLNLVILALSLKLYTELCKERVKKG